MERLGVGIGWRPEIDLAVEQLDGLDWVEVVAENLCADHLPPSIQALLDRGLTVIPHGVGLGIGGAERPDPARLRMLAERVELLGAPLVTEHLAFVRAGTGAGTGTGRLEAGHLLPVPHTRDALKVVVEHVRIAQDSLPVPLGLENIAALLRWPNEDMTEAQFLAELVERTGVRLLIDVANLHTNHVNLGIDPAKELDRLPVSAIAYVHVAGGIEVDGVWHDTHTHPVTEPVLDVLAELCRRTEPAGVLLERDGDFPAPKELRGELDAIREVLREHRPAQAAEPTAARPAATASTPTAAAEPPVAPATRERLATAQSDLLAALLADGPVPDGFDTERVRVQARALVAKRADVVAKVAPRLPEILGAHYRREFLRYGRGRPLPGGARADALAFARFALAADDDRPATERTALDEWIRGASGRFAGRRGRLRHVWWRLARRFNDPAVRVAGAA